MEFVSLIQKFYSDSGQKATLEFNLLKPVAVKLLQIETEFVISGYNNPFILNVTYFNKESDSIEKIWYINMHPNPVISLVIENSSENENFRCEKISIEYIERKTESYLHNEIAISFITKSFSPAERMEYDENRKLEHSSKYL